MRREGRAPRTEGHAASDEGRPERGFLGRTLAAGAIFVIIDGMARGSFLTLLERLRSCDEPWSRTP